MRTSTTYYVYCFSLTKSVRFTTLSSPFMLSRLPSVTWLLIKSIWELTWYSLWPRSLVCSAVAVRLDWSLLKGVMEPFFMAPVRTDSGTFVFREPLAFSMFIYYASFFFTSFALNKLFILSFIPCRKFFFVVLIGLEF